MKKLIFSTVLFNTPLRDLKRLIKSIDLLNKELIKKFSGNVSIEFLIWDNSKIFSNYEKDLNFLNYKFDIKLVHSNK